MASIGEKLKAGAAIAGVAAVALLGVGIVKEKVLGQDECVTELWNNREQLVPGGVGYLACIAGAAEPGFSGGAVTEIEMKGMKPISKELMVGFGTAQIEMGGQAYFGYNGARWQDLLGDKVDDVKLYYNKGNKNTTKVVVVPCFNMGDFEKGINLDKEEPTDGDLQSKVHVELNPTEDGKDIKNVVIDAGTFDLCVPHVAQTQEMEDMWWGPKYDWGTMPSDLRNTYYFMMKDLMTKAALASACPEEITDMKAVETTLKSVVQGSIKTDTPEQAAAVARAFSDPTKVTVKMDPPEQRQDYYAKDFRRTREAYTSGAKFRERGLEIDKMEISDINIKACTVKKDGLPQKR